MVVEDALVDIIRSGFDLDVRYEESLSPDMIAVSIGAPQRSTLAASPQRHAQWGAPHSPEDLARLPAIRHRFPSGALLPWEFTSGKRTVRINPPARLVTNHVNMGVAAAMAGCGLLLTFHDYVATPFQNGRLVPLLEDWLPPFRGPFLYYFHAGRWRRPLGRLSISCGARLVRRQLHDCIGTARVSGLGLTSDPDI